VFLSFIITIIVIVEYRQKLLKELLIFIEKWNWSTWYGINKISIDEELGKLDGGHLEEGVRESTHLCHRLVW